MMNKEEYNASSILVPVLLYNSSMVHHMTANVRSHRLVQK
jgi:hypothetical protein